jgi:hypothetical protein
VHAGATLEDQEDNQWDCNSAEDAEKLKLGVGEHWARNQLGDRVVHSYDFAGPSFSDVLSGRATLEDYRLRQTEFIPKKEDWVNDSTDHDRFLFRQLKDGRIKAKVERMYPVVHEPIAEQAARNVFSGVELHRGAITQRQWLREGQTWNVLTLPTYNTVHENWGYYDYQTGQTTKRETTYLRGGHGQTTEATAKDVVKPQQGCQLERPSPDSNLVTHSVFRIRQNCDEKADPQTLAKEFNQGKFVP